LSNAELFFQKAGTWSAQIIHASLRARLRLRLGHYCPLSKAWFASSKGYPEIQSILQGLDSSTYHF